MKACFYRRTSLGMIRIEEENERITRLSFESEFPDQEECEIVETACLWQAFVQLRQYLDGERQQFELILQPQGTAFQKEAWQALLDIPYGQTRTYRSRRKASAGRKRYGQSAWRIIAIRSRFSFRVIGLLVPGMNWSGIAADWP